MLQIVELRGAAPILRMAGILCAPAEARVRLLATALADSLPRHDGAAFVILFARRQRAKSVHAKRAPTVPGRPRVRV